MQRCRAVRPSAIDDTTTPRRPHAGPRRFAGRGAHRPQEALAHGERPRLAEPPDAQKLLIIIASDTDADALVRAMVERGHAATKIGSTGGFLRRGNTTLLVGVPAVEVDAVLGLVARTCPARTELLTIGALPFTGEVPYLSEPVEVRAGGAVAFVLNVERFERV